MVAAPNQTTSPHGDRYAGLLRLSGGAACGLAAGILLIGSIQVGVGYAVEGHNPSEGDWNLLLWGNHWMWRGIWSLATTAVAGFIAGMVARRRGRRVAIISALPFAAYWVYVAYAGWIDRVPFGTVAIDVPLGYRIVATILAFLTLPLAAAGGSEGAPYGRANAEHFDSRRWTLLGIRWYHYVWLPFLVHVMVISVAFGCVYGFQWFALAWRNGPSMFVLIPVVFYTAMIATMQLLGSGAFRTYEALAGFNKQEGAVWRRVLKYGFGYTIATAAIQSGIILVHYGLTILARKISG